MSVLLLSPRKQRATVLKVPNEVAAAPFQSVELLGENRVTTVAFGNFLAMAASPI